MRKQTTVGQATADISRRRQAYQLVSNQPAGQIVIQDLAEFCYGYETCYDPDPRIHARKEGRRDVWLRLQAHLKLTDDQLFDIATGGFVLPQPQDDYE